MLSTQKNKNFLDYKIYACQIPYFEQANQIEEKDFLYVIVKC